MEINTIEELEKGFDEFNSLLSILGLKPTFDEKYYGFWDFVRKNNVKVNIPLSDAIEVVKRKLSEGN